MTDQDFEKERQEIVAQLAKDTVLRDKTLDWLAHAQERKYSYQFDWLGLPIIQYPQDLVAMQELVWNLKPDLVIETGIARGGSAIFYASLLELNALCGGPQGAEVVAIDIDIRAYNRVAIKNHPMARRLSMIEGSSIDPEVVTKVAEKAKGKNSVLVCLDSNHTHEHVLDELRAYAPMTTSGSYCVVFDTLVEDLPPDAIGDRPWSPGNSPMTAVQAYLSEDNRFEIDHDRHNKLQITVARNGFLKRVA